MYVGVCGSLVYVGVCGSLSDGDEIHIRGLRSADKTKPSGLYLETNRQGQIGLWATKFGPEQRWRIHVLDGEPDGLLRNGNHLELYGMAGKSKKRSRFT